MLVPDQNYIFRVAAVTGSGSAAPAHGPLSDQTAVLLIPSSGGTKPLPQKAPEAAPKPVEFSPTATQEGFDVVVDWQSSIASESWWAGAQGVTGFIVYCHQV